MTGPHLKNEKQREDDQRRWPPATTCTVLRTYITAVAASRPRVYVLVGSRPGSMMHLGNYQGHKILALLVVA